MIMYRGDGGGSYSPRDTSQDAMYLDGKQPDLLRINTGRGRMSKVLVSPDGKYLLVGCWNFSYTGMSHIYIWNIETQSIVHTFQASDFARDSVHFSAVTFHPKGEQIAVGLSTGSIWIVPITSSAPVKRLLLSGSGIPVNTIRFSPDGLKYSYLLTNVQTVYVRRTDGTKKLVKFTLPEKLSCLAFSLDSKLLAVAGGGQLYVMDAEAGSFVWEDRHSRLGFDPIDIVLIRANELLLFCPKSIVALSITPDPSIISAKITLLSKSTMTHGFASSACRNLIAYKARRRVTVVNRITGEVTYSKSIDRVSDSRISMSSDARILVYEEHLADDEIAVRIIDFGEPMPGFTHDLDEAFV